MTRIDRDNEQIYRWMLIVFGLLTGVLEVVNGLNIGAPGSLTTEWVYIATDFSILLILVGLLGELREQFRTIGFLGWLVSFFGFAFIAGPSAEIGGVDAYVIGSSIAGLGLAILSVELIRLKLIPLLVPILILVTIVLSVLDINIEIGALSIAVANFTLGLAFASLGFLAIQHRHLQRIKAIPIIESA